MPSLEKEQLLAYCHETYHSLVRRNRVGPNRDQEQLTAAWDRAFPGRALGCFYLQTALGITPTEATTADVDGGGDEGIDGFHYDSSSHRLILLQAKGGGDGTDSQPSLADVNRFVTGVKSFLSGEHAHFKELSISQQELAREACNDTALKISVVLVHFGGELSEHSKRQFEQLSSDINANYDETRLQVVNFNREKAHKALLRLKSDDPVTCRLNLESYAKHDGELRCFYGLALASDLKQLHLDNQANPSLYAQNVRAFYGDNPVNLRVKETLTKEPKLLFYLNNGVTAICRKIDPTPQSQPGGRGEFQIEDISIVNGAQTIGTIAQNLRDQEASAHVFVKIIEVPDSNKELSLKIARATNLQTSVDSLDFLSTHARHQELAQTLKESGVMYQFKRSAEYGTDRLAADKFTVQEAIEARICNGGEAKLLRNLKVQPAKLHEDFRNDMDSLFPADLSARTLWRQIQISRIAQQVITGASGANSTKYHEAFFTHGVFFLKHLILKKSRAIQTSENMNISAEEFLEIENLQEPVALEAFTIADNLFSAGLGENERINWNYIFKGKSNLEELLRLTAHLTY